MQVTVLALKKGLSLLSAYHKRCTSMLGIRQLNRQWLKKVESIKRPCHKLKYLEKDTKSKKHNRQKMWNMGSIGVTAVTVEEIRYLKKKIFFWIEVDLERVYNPKFAIDFRCFQ